MMKPGNNGLEPAQADRLHDAVRAINKSLASWTWGGGGMRYKLATEVAGDREIVDFLVQYYTHALLKTTSQSRESYLLIERIG